MVLSAGYWENFVYKRAINITSCFEFPKLRYSKSRIVNIFGVQKAKFFINFYDFKNIF